MFRHSLLNLAMTLYSGILSALCRIPGWRYPLTSRVDDGVAYIARGTQLELALFNKLKYSPQMQLLKKIRSPLVLIATIQGGSLVINAYRLIRDRGQTDIAIPTQHAPGRHGRFHFLCNDGRLYHALRPTSVTRRMGFIENEPVFSLQLSMSERELTYARELEDRPRPQLMEGELITGDPRIALGILAEPVQ